MSDQTEDDERVRAVICGWIAEDAEIERKRQITRYEDLLRHYRERLHAVDDGSRKRESIVMASDSGDAEITLKRVHSVLVDLGYECSEVKQGRNSSEYAFTVEKGTNQ